MAQRSASRQRPGPRRAPVTALPLAAERGRLLSLWLAVFATLAWIPGGFTRFVFAKLLVLAIAGAIGALVPRQGRLPRSVVIAVGVGLAVTAVAALASQTPVASLVGRWPRYEGLPVLALYVASGWLGARLVGRGATRVVQVAHALAAMALVLTVATLLELAGASPLGDVDDRAGALLGNATDQGLVAMMAALVIAAVVADRRDDVLLLAGLGGTLVTVAASGSRTSLALTALGLLAVALVRSRALLRPAAVAVAVLAAAAVAVPGTRERLLSTTTGEGRLTQWRLTLDLVADHPLLGVGPSGYVDAFGPYESAAWVDFTGPWRVADSPHNLLLQALVVGGLPLLGCLVAVAVLAGRRALAVVRAHPESLGPAMAVAAYSAGMLLNFTAAASTCLAVFLAGVVLAEQVDRPEPRWRSPAVASVFGVAAVLLLAACLAEVRLATAVERSAAGDLPSATAALDGARAWRPYDGDLAMLGAQSLAALADGQVPGAGEATEEWAARSLDRTPESYQARVALAVGLRAQGRLEEADEVLDAAVAQSPERPDAYLQRGVVAMLTGDLAAARIDVARALEIAPRWRAAAGLLRRLERAAG